MAQYLLYFLVFLFGYVTCKTFYFLSSTKKSIKLIQLSQVVGLLVITKGLENFHYSKYYRLALMQENKASQQNIDAFTRSFNDEVSQYKEKAIKTMIDSHGSFFDQLVEFNDWESAMTYLERNKDVAREFLTGN